MALSGGNRFCPLIISQQDVSPHHGMMVELKIASHISQEHYSSSTLSNSHGYPPSPQKTLGTRRVWQAVVLYLSEHVKSPFTNWLLQPLSWNNTDHARRDSAEHSDISASAPDSRFQVASWIMTPAWSRPWLWDSLTVGYRSKLHPYYWDTVTVTPRLLRQGHCLLLGGLWHLCWIYPVW